MSPNRNVCTAPPHMLHVHGLCMYKMCAHPVSCQLYPPCLLEQSITTTHLPLACLVTPRKLLVVLVGPLDWRRSTATNSSPRICRAGGRAKRVNTQVQSNQCLPSN